MKPAAKKTYSTISAILLTLFSFLLPIFFLPLNIEFYEFNKRTLLFVFVLIFSGIWAIKTLQKKTIKIKTTSSSLPVLILATITLLSIFFQSPNKIHSLQTEGGTIIAVCLLYLAITNLVPKKKFPIILSGLIISSAILSWLTIFSSLGLGESLPITWLRSKAWSPTGSILNTITFAILIFPATLFYALKCKDNTEKTLLFIASGLQIITILCGSILFINKTVTLTHLNPIYGWSIIAKGFQNIKTALLGVGPTNFPNAFSIFRPAALNQTDYWNVKFLTNSNTFFHLLSIIGLLGFASYTAIFLNLLKDGKKKISLSGGVLSSIVTGLILQALLPYNVTTLTILFIFLSFTSKRKIILKKNTAQIPTLGLLVPILSLLLIVGCFYSVGKTWAADYFMSQSLKAAQANEAVKTYKLQIKAIKLNPHEEKYRTTYSNTNLALANSLAGQKEISDENKNKIIQLISQSIRESKIAVSLNSTNAGNWLNLANIYNSLTNLTKEATQWAISSFIQAAKTDPTNPIIRLRLGGLFYASGDYERANEQFRISISLKPNYANGYYNLAHTFIKQEKWSEAYESMRITLQLVPQDSNDYTKTKKELEKLEEKLKQPKEIKTEESLESKQEEELSTPPPFPTPNPAVGTVNLPEELEPEIPPEEPSPTPEPTPSPQSTKKASPSGQL